MLRSVRRAFAALLLLALAPAAGLQAQTQAPYELDAILSLTGPAAPLGTGENAALRVAEKLVNEQGGLNGRPIRIVVADDQSNPQVAVQLVTGLIQKHVPVILGPAVGATCGAVAPLINAAGPLTYCFSPQVHPTKDGYLYTVIMSGLDVAAGMLRFYRGQGFRRIALIATTDASGQGGEADVKEALALPEYHDLQLVADEHFNPLDLTVSAQLARIRAAGAQALLVFSPGTPFATVLRGMHEAGMDLPTATTQANMSLAQIRQYDAFVPKDLYFQSIPPMAAVAANAAVRRAQSVFFDALKKNDVPLDAVVCIPWDPTMLVVDALRRFGAGMTATQLRGYVESLHAWPGTIGLYDFSRYAHRGLSQKDVLIMRWDKTRDQFAAASALGGAPLPGTRASR